MTVSAGFSEIIRSNIKLFRKQAELTQAELAQKCGVSASTIAHIESSGSGISLHILEQISVNLEKPMYLFFMDENLQKRICDMEIEHDTVKKMLTEIINYLQ